MSQAISNKVLVQSSKYCWMICDYTMSGTTLNYSLSFYFEGGCAQLDNAWIKVGSTIVDSLGISRILYLSIVARLLLAVLRLSRSASPNTKIHQYLAPLWCLAVLLLLDLL